MTTPFRQLHHLCIVVHDLKKKVAYYESIGIGPWYDYPTSKPYSELAVPNPEGSHAMRYKCVDFENFTLQLCQPSTHDTPQRRFLDSHGEGVYHLGFTVDDLAGEMAEAKELGLTTMSYGHRADASGFCYFDTREQAGVTLEIRAD